MYVLPLLQSERAARSAWLRGIGSVLGSWPQASLSLPGKRARRALQGHNVCVELLQVYHSHTIIFVGHRRRWVCVACGRSTRCRGRRAFERATCKRPGGNSAEEKVAKSARARALQHDPKWGVTTGGAPLLVCLRCGSVSEAREGGMKNECPGAPQSTGASYRLGRFLKGLHPRQAGVEVRHLGLGRP